LKFAQISTSCPDQKILNDATLAIQKSSSFVADFGTENRNLFDVNFWPSTNLDVQFPIREISETINRFAKIIPCQKDHLKIDQAGKNDEVSFID